MMASVVRVRSVDIVSSYDRCGSAMVDAALTDVGEHGGLGS